MWALCVKGTAGRGRRRVRDPGADTLYQRLRSCLALQHQYRESLRGVRDGLGASNLMSHHTSISSLAAPTK